MDQAYYNNVKENNSGTTERRRSTPKNIRQIGKIEDDLKIYVEDYVKTYMKQLSEEEFSESPVAVLVGEYQRTEEERAVFIYGAIRVQQVWNEDNIVFTEDTWTEVYEAIKKYFPEAEIAGWYICGNDFRNQRAEMIKTTHLDNFAGRDKLLLLYDITEKEEQFLRYENGEMCSFSGYFVYYEKNEEMQGYMVDHKQQRREELFVEDRVVREFRNHSPAYEDGEENRKEKSIDKVPSSGSQTIRRTLYLAGSMLTLVVLAVGVTAMKNQEKMKGLEETIHTITASLNGGEKEGDKIDSIFDTGPGGEVQGGNQTASEEGSNTLSVEASSSGISGGEKEKNPTGLPEKTNQQEPTGVQPTISAIPDDKNDEDINSPSGTDKKNDDKNDAAGNKGSTAGKGNDSDVEEDTPKNSDKNSTDTDALTNGDKSEKDDNTIKNNSKGEDSTEKDSPGNSKGDNNNDTESESGNSVDNGSSEGKKEGDETQDTSGPALTGDDVFIYTVKKGDTLAGICYKLYGTISKMEFIKTMNQIVNEDKIYIGQQLVVPNME